jgi:predicted transcriptional regulator of viral defense system
MEQSECGAARLARAVEITAVEITAVEITAVEITAVECTQRPSSPGHDTTW